MSNLSPSAFSAAIALLAAVSACGGVTETVGGAGAGGAAATGGSTATNAPGGASSTHGGTNDAIDPNMPAGASSQETIVTLSTAAKEPTALVVDASFVYFTDFGENSSGALFKTPIDGGATQPLLTALNNPAGLALSGQNLYVSAGSSLLRTDLDGKNGSSLATTFSNDPIVLGPGGVYGTGHAGSDTNVAIVNVALGGGAVTALTGDGALDNSSFESYGLAVDASSLYFATFSAPMSILKVSLQGGAIQTLAQSAGPGGGIAIDGASVYWSDGSGLSKVSKTGGSVQKLSSVPAGFVGGIAVDASNVYWTSASTVQRVALDGGPTFTLADNQATPGVIAVDDHSVYWANSGQAGGVAAIMKATPK